MKTKKSKSSRYHKFLKTNHVFVDENQVYLKKDILEADDLTEQTIQWFPVNFQWSSQL